MWQTIKINPVKYSSNSWDFSTRLCVNVYFYHITYNQKMSVEDDTELRDLVAQTLEANGCLPKIRVSNVSFIRGFSLIQDWCWIKGAAASERIPCFRWRWKHK